MNNKKITTYPLKSITLDQAIALQHHIVKMTAANFSGQELLSLGDLGVKQPQNQPIVTHKVEKTISHIFDAKAALLVTGAGTGALRWAIYSALLTGKKVLVHQAPIYPTTKVSLEFAGAKIIKADFNNLKELETVIKSHPDLSLAIVQYTRQKLDDQYDYAKIIKTIKSLNSKIKVITDDNYAIFKTGNTGIDFGADLATFSGFKVLGPEGVGVIIGNQAMIQTIKKANYSGGSQVQGWQAMELLRAMTYAPVALAIQAQVIQTTYDQLIKNPLPEIKNVYIANAQSKVIIIEFKSPIAQKVLASANNQGALPNPIGAESKYEITPLFYRVSNTFSKSIKNAQDYFIRINPNRAGTELIMSILQKAIDEATCS